MFLCGCQKYLNSQNANALKDIVLKRLIVQAQPQVRKGYVQNGY